MGSGCFLPGHTWRAVKRSFSCSSLTRTTSEATKGLIYKRQPNGALVPSAPYRSETCNLAVAAGRPCSSYSSHLPHLMVGDERSVSPERARIGDKRPQSRRWGQFPLSRNQTRARTSRLRPIWGLNSVSFDAPHPPSRSEYRLGVIGKDSRRNMNNLFAFGV